MNAWITLRVRSHRYWLQALLMLGSAVVLLTWLAYTPPGLLGKADALAYAVCHRLPGHSFFLGDRPLPLCARCSGLYLGALLGLYYQYRRGPADLIPPRKFLLVLGLFLLVFAADGINSFLSLFPGAPGLYEPQNIYRLLTGTGVGLGIAVLLYPILFQTIYRDLPNRPAFKSWRQFGSLLLLALAVDVLILSDNPLLLYPLALISALAIPLVLGLCYGMVWIILFRREGTFPTASHAWVPLLAGFATALLQVALIDWGRFLWTGTWGGLPF